VSEYIKRADALKALNTLGGFEKTSTMFKKIQEVPSLDIVLCKNCRNACVFDYTLYCTYWSRNTREDCFCQEGEEKTV